MTMQENGENTKKKGSHIVKVEMPSGYTRNVQLVGRYAFNECQPEHFPNIANDFENLKRIEIRQDDVILVTYPKSGTHWASEILKMITTRKAEYDRFPKWKEGIDRRSSKELEELKSPRILNTHLHVQDLPYGILEKKCKTAIVLRNPKDVCVSQYCQVQTLKIFNGTWDDFLCAFTDDKYPVYTDWFAYVLDAHEFAAKHRFVYTMYYENLHKNPFDEIKKLVNFLEVWLSDELIQDIAEKCSFGNLKEATSKKPSASGDLMNTPHLFRKGQIGDWKNWFTVAQSERFDAVYKTRMQGCDIQFTFAVNGS